MSKAAPTTTDSKNSYEAFKQAYEAYSDVLDHILEEEGFDAFLEAQKEYFSLRAEAKARDPTFQNVDLSGTRLNVPHSDHVFDPPTVEEEHGEWEVPTRAKEDTDHFRVLDSISVLRPDESSFTEHSVSIDHVITPEGEVTVEVNALELDQLTEAQGSYIR